MISLGGPMGANDERDHPWILKEMELLQASVVAELPVAGVCLGGQMLARALGSRVEPMVSTEVGWFPIQLSPDGRRDRILAGAGVHPLVYHWHHDSFHLPDGAVLLAQSKACPRQAYRVGENAYGFQFHPEADHQLVHEWLSIDGVEGEIVDVLNCHGPECVQVADIQRNHALQGEKASLRITAGIGQLFRKKEYEPVGADFYEQMETWATLRWSLILEFEGSDRKPLHLRGTIFTIFQIPDGEFLLFREENTLLWPIRLDYIKSLTPVST
jgi:GMP synthase-like glutamine amidotransferase